MERVCNKCGHRNPFGDVSPTAACPGCGAIYAKLEVQAARTAAQHTKKEVAWSTWAMVGVAISAAFLVGAVWNSRLRTVAPVQSTSAAMHAVTNCTTTDAHRLLRNLQTMTEWGIEGEFVTVRVLPEYWELLSADKLKQREFVEAIANTDACVAGRPREIDVYSPSYELIGHANPRSGIRTE